MSPMRRVLYLLLLAGAVAATWAAAQALAASAPKVTSTLDGKKVLPIRMHWIAHTHIPEAQISRVDFLIDGKLHTTHTAPITGSTDLWAYGDADSLSTEGFLITTWLTPGEHRFTVRVVETKGTKAIDTVTARVLPAPQPPAALAGAWTRVVTAQDVQKAQPQYGNPPPVGTWILYFDRIGAWELDPMHTGLVNEYDAEPGIIHVYAPIQMGAPFSCNSGGTCHGGVSRFGYGPLGGNDCTWNGPFGTYQWTVTGTTLTLTATHDACGDRQAIWEGTWTRTTP
jgi:hypothetical protein